MTSPLYRGAAATLALCAFTPSFACAQENLNRLDTIIVTGTKQPGLNLDDAPIGATVLSGDTISELRIDTISELAEALPGLSIQRLGQAGGLFLTVRGIASNPFVVSRTAVYVDGVPFRDLNDLLLADVESVAFLRGPQSQLYGLNSEAGAIIIDTARPGDSFSGQIDLRGERWESDAEMFQGSATLSGPITDNMAGRLTIVGRTGDAFNRNFGASDGREGALHEIGIRGRLAADLPGQIESDLIVSYERLDAPGVYEQEYLPINRDLYNELYADQFNDGFRVERNQLFQDAAKDTTEEAVSASLRLRRAFDAFEIVSVSAYREENDAAVGTEFDLTAFELFRGSDADEETLFSQELRIASAPDASVKWLAGLYFLDESDRQTLATQNLAAGEPNLVPASDQTREGQDYAAFGQVVIPFFSDRARLTLGARYEIAERRTSQEEQTFNVPTGVFVTPEIELEDDFDAFLPRVALDISLNENWIAYASASEGWLPGGFNLIAAREDVAEDLVSYDSETLRSSEAGVKGAFLDGRGTLTTALFWIEAENWQEFNLATDQEGNAISTTIITSDADVRSRGAEAQILFEASDAFDLGLGATYTDAEYTRYEFGPGVDFSGNRPAFAPEYEISGRATWRPTDRLTASTSIAVQGNTPLNAENNISQDTYVLWDAAVTYRLGDIDATLFVENLLDEAFFNGLGFSNFALGNDGVDYAPAGAPRSYGVELRYAW